jgi:hypothetical protein
MASLQNRMIGAMKLQAATFEDVEHDTSAMGQAATVVLLASLASGIGWIWYGGMTGILRGMIVALVGWLISSTLIWLIGTRLMPGRNTQADLPQMLRVLGFAQAPGVFQAASIVPILGWLIWFVVTLWTIAAAVVAVRQGLDYDDTLKAVIVCVIAFVVWIVVAMIFGLGTAMMGGT